MHVVLLGFVSGGAVSLEKDARPKIVEDGGLKKLMKINNRK